jgi:hypothetical protein
MYTALRDDTEYANAAQAWQNFVTLRADQCKTIRAYIGIFRDVLIDLDTAGVSFKWVKPKSTTTTDDSGVGELIVIHFVEGLNAVFQNWLRLATTIFVVIAHGRSTRSSRPSEIPYVTRTASQSRPFSRSPNRRNSAALYSDRLRVHMIHPGYIS